MDVVLDILGFLGNPVKYWKVYADLAETHRWTAVFVGVPAVIYLSYIGLGQLYGLIERYRDVLRLGALRATAISASILILALVGSYAIVHVIAQARSVRPVLERSDLLIGRQIVLNWSYAGKDQQDEVRYEVQSAKDERFAEDLRIEHRCIPGKFLLIPRDFNETRYVRVRAVTLEEGADVSKPDGENRPLSPWSEALPVTQYRNALERITRTGQVEIYTSDSLNQGFFMFTKRDGQATGFDIALARMIVSKLGRRLGLSRELKPLFVPVPWERLLSTPASGKADFVIASVTSRPERERQFGIKFSVPYYQTTLSLIHRADTSIRSVRDALPGKRVGVQDQTTSDAIVTLIEKGYTGRKKPSVVRFRQSLEALEKLQAATAAIDFVVADTPFAIGAVQMTRASTGDVLASTEFTAADFPPTASADMRSEPYAIAIRSAETKLVEHINAILNELNDAGALHALEERMKSEYLVFLRQP